MKKLFSLLAAVLVISGLKAQTTQVKKETVAPKPATITTATTTKKSVSLKKEATIKKSVSAPEIKKATNVPIKYSAKPFKNS